MRITVVEPGYLELYKSGELEERGEALAELLHRCTLCPRECCVNRYSDERGHCRTGVYPRVASFHAHHGEEPCLVGRGAPERYFFHFAILSAFIARIMISLNMDMGTSQTFRNWRILC